MWLNSWPLQKNGRRPGWVTRLTAAGVAGLSVVLASGAREPPLYTFDGSISRPVLENYLARCGGWGVSPHIVAEWR